MPTPYIQKQAKKHHVSLNTSEEKWAKAKRIAAKEGKGGNYAYVTGIYKSMMGENMSYPTFKTFLMVESDLEDVSGQSMTLEPNVDSNDEGGMDELQDHPDMMGGEDDFGQSQHEPVDLDNDERFLELKSNPQSKPDALRIRQLSQTNPEEVEQELQDAHDKHFAGRGTNMSQADSAMHMGADDEEGFDQSNLASLPKMTDDEAESDWRPVGESLLSSLIFKRK